MSRSLLLGRPHWPRSVELLTQNVERAFSSHNKIQGRYFITPIDLFRIVSSSKKIVLREKAKQAAKGSQSFDFIIGKDGLIHPAPLDGKFIGPNGASFRPATINMWDVLSQRNGKAFVAEVPKGTQLPDGLVMLHENNDHYSLQCVEAMTPSALVSKINSFLATCEVYPKETYFAKFPLPQHDD